MLARLAIPPALIAALLAALPAPAAGTAAPEAGTGLTSALLPASVKLAECSREGRLAAFHGRMSGIDQSRRMWMRFTVLEKRADGYEAVDAPGLERWRRSKSGVGAFGFRQTVRNLQQGASYRMEVDFRWYDAEHELIAKTQRRSAPCRQFVELPNLTAELAGTKETKAMGVVRYRVRVANESETSASGVAVRLSVDGGVVDTVTVAHLRAGESRLVAFRGPPCTESVTATADPDGVLLESSEDDNSQSLPCAGRA